MRPEDFILATEEGTDYVRVSKAPPAPDVLLIGSVTQEFRPVAIKDVLLVNHWPAVTQIRWLDTNGRREECCEIDPGIKFEPPI
jgi:hypothetical protein